MRKVSPYTKPELSPEYQAYVDQLDMRIKQVGGLIEAVAKCVFLDPVEIAAFQEEARWANSTLSKHLYGIKHEMEIDADEWRNFFISIDFFICKRLNWLRQRFHEAQDASRRNFARLVDGIIAEKRGK